MFLMSGLREFQRRGAERLKALDPMVDRRAGGTVRLMEEADLRVCGGDQRGGNCNNPRGGDKTVEQDCGAVGCE